MIEKLSGKPKQKDLVEKINEIIDVINLTNPPTVIPYSPMDNGTSTIGLQDMPTIIQNNE